MRRHLVVLLLLVCAAAQAQERPEALFNLVTLSAQAVREVANDTLTATLAADSEGNDPAALADALNRTMRDALKLAQGYNSVRTRSGNYQTFPVYDKTRIARWRVRQELRIESQDFAQATELIGKLQATLIVSGLAVGLSPEARKQAENAVIAEALKAFHERAGIVRDAQKSKGYRVKELQIGGGGGVQPRMYTAQRADMAASSAPPAIEPGVSNIQINVNGTIQLE